MSSLCSSKFTAALVVLAFVGTVQRELDINTQTARHKQEIEQYKMKLTSMQTDFEETLLKTEEENSRLWGELKKYRKTQNYQNI